MGQKVLHKDWSVWGAMRSVSRSAMRSVSRGAMRSVIRSAWATRVAVSADECRVAFVFSVFSFFSGINLVFGPTVEGMGLFPEHLLLVMMMMIDDIYHHDRQGWDQGMGWQ